MNCRSATSDVPSAGGNGLLALLGRLDRDRRGLVLCTVMLLAAGAGALNPLIDRYYDYPFEPDSPPTVEHTLAFLSLCHGGKITDLPPLSDYPSYYDAQYLVYAAGAVLVQGLRAVHCPGLPAFATDQSLVIFTIRHLNALVYVASCVTFFFAVRMICCSHLISFLLALILLFSPPIIRMDLMRIDHLIFFLLCTIIHRSMLVAAGRDRAASNLILGMALAAIANTKIVGAAFGFIPAVAMLLAFLGRRYSRRGFAWFLAGLLGVWPLLWWRYLLTPAVIPGDWIAKWQAHRLWNLYFPVRPYFYYNWHYLREFGLPFLVLSAMAFVAVLARLRRGRCGSRALIVCCFILLSILLLPMQKYHRGGYFLIPFYLLLMGLAATLALASVRHRCKSAGFRALARLTLACSLASILAQVFLVYRTIREEASQRSASERTTRIEPRAWFRDHVLPGARIGIVDGSELYGPPVWDLGHTTVPTLLPQYWLFPDKLQTQVPPTIAEVEAQTDILVFSNFSLWALDKALRNFAPENLRRNWQPFFGELRDRYPLVVFESAHENYTVSAVKIYVVNSSILRDVDTALRSVPDRGMTFMPPRNGAMPAAATQRPFAWLGEYDDSTLPCIHHDGLGRLMLAKDAKDADLWFYAEGLNGWFWTRKTIYPCLLRQDDGVWLRYEGQTERGPILRELQQPDGDVDR